MSQHTPGGLSSTGYRGFDGWTVPDDDPPRGMTEANARLIAAAPELLEACKHMLDFCPPGLLPDLKAAIQKAEASL